MRRKYKPSSRLRNKVRVDIMSSNEIQFAIGVGCVVDQGSGLDNLTARIADFIFSGPVDVEILSELGGLLELVAGSYADEFAIFELFEEAIHGGNTSLLPGRVPT